MAAAKNENETDERLRQFELANKVLAQFENLKKDAGMSGSEFSESITAVLDSLSGDLVSIILFAYLFNNPNRIYNFIHHWLSRPHSAGQTLFEFSRAIMRAFSTGQFELRYKSFSSTHYDIQFFDTPRLGIPCQLLEDIGSACILRLFRGSTSVNERNAWNDIETTQGSVHRNTMFDFKHDALMDVDCPIGIIARRNLIFMFSSIVLDQIEGSRELHNEPVSHAAVRDQFLQAVQAALSEAQIDADAQKYVGVSLCDATIAQNMRKMKRNLAEMEKLRAVRQQVVRRIENMSQHERDRLCIGAGDIPMNPNAATESREIVAVDSHALVETHVAAEARRANIRPNIVAEYTGGNARNLDAVMDATRKELVRHESGITTMTRYKPENKPPTAHLDAAQSAMNAAATIHDDAELARRSKGAVRAGLSPACSVGSARRKRERTQRIVDANAKATNQNGDESSDDDEPGTLLFDEATGESQMLAPIEDSRRKRARHVPSTAELVQNALPQGLETADGSVPKEHELLFALKNPAYIDTDIADILTTRPQINIAS